MWWVGGDSCGGRMQGRGWWEGAAGRTTAQCQSRQLGEGGYRLSAICLTVYLALRGLGLQ